MISRCSWSFLGSSNFYSAKMPRRCWDTYRLCYLAEKEETYKVVQFSMISCCCFPSSFRPFRIKSLDLSASKDYRCNKARFTKPRVYSKCQTWEDMRVSQLKCRWKVAFFADLECQDFDFFMDDWNPLSQWSLFEFSEATWFARIGHHNCVVQILVVAQSISWPPPRQCANLGKMWQDMVPQKGIYERQLASIFVDVHP